MRLYGSNNDASIVQRVVDHSGIVAYNLAQRTHRHCTLITKVRRGSRRLTKEYLDQLVEAMPTKFSDYEKTKLYWDAGYVDSSLPSLTPELYKRIMK